MYNPKAYRKEPIGVVVRKKPGVTRWQRWSWTVSGLLLPAQPAHWRELRRVGDVTEYHAATLPLELHGAEAEAYVHNLQAQVPSLYVVLRQAPGDYPYEVLLVTASPYEAQDYTESGDDIVEKVAMPPALLEVVQGFIDDHYEEEVFVKRKRKNKRIDQVQDGIGDPRIGKPADIYASPALVRRRVQ